MTQNIPYKGGVSYKIWEGTGKKEEDTKRIYYFSLTERSTWGDQHTGKIFFKGER